MLVAVSVAVASPQEQILAARVACFEFHGKEPARGHVAAQVPGGVLDAALALAFHTSIRICVEEFPRDEDTLKVPIEIKVKNKTVEEILKQMIAQDPRYQYRQRLGVIEVFPVRAEKDSADCLNMVIPSFRVKQPRSRARREVPTLCTHPIKSLICLSRTNRCETYSSR